MASAAGTKAGLFVIGPEGEVSPLGSAGDFRPGPSVLALLSEETRPLLPIALKRHRSVHPDNALTLLVPPRAAPELSARNDGAVVAFLASGPWVESVLEWEPCSPVELCYRALSAVLDGGQAPIALNVVDKAVEAGPAIPRESLRVDAMVPHRGRDDHLKAALSGLARQTYPCRTLLCFDQSPEPGLCRELAKRDDLDLFEVVPSPAGPYVPRQHFAMTSTARYMAFQDSDDFSLASRVERLVAFAEEREADMVGCHELRHDEMTRTVEAVRYPLDVNEALRSGAGHAQLFSTTVARVDTLRRIGGFSTMRTFGADKQFLLRAYWSARMLNMDDFLYVRRLRDRSLTTSAATGMGSAVRQEVTRRWKEAFQDIKDGRIGAAESALRIEHTSDEFKIRNLRTGAQSPALLRTATGDELAK